MVPPLSQRGPLLRAALLLLLLARPANAASATATGAAAAVHRTLCCQGCQQGGSLPRLLPAQQAVLPPPVPLLVPLRLQPRHLSNKLGCLQHQRLKAAQQYHAGSCLGAAVQVQQQQLAQLQPALLLLRGSAIPGPTVGAALSIGAACAAPAVEQQPKGAVAGLAVLADATHLQRRLPVLVQAVGSRARAALPSQPLLLPLLLLQGAACIPRQLPLRPRCCCSCCPLLRLRLPVPLLLLLLLLLPPLLLDLARLCHHICCQGWVAAKGQGKHPLSAVIGHRTCRHSSRLSSRPGAIKGVEEEAEQVIWQSRGSRAQQQVPGSGAGGGIS